MPGPRQIVGGVPKGGLIDIREHHRGPSLGERSGCRQAHPGTRSGDKGHLAFKVVGGVHAAPPRSSGTSLSVVARAWGAIIGST